MNNEESIKRIEGAILKTTDLLLVHDGRMDDFYKALRESREDFEFKMNALIDAPINNQSEISELKQSSIELRIASQSQLVRIEKLESN